MTRPQDNLVFQKALEYVAAGLSVIPTVKETKAPALQEWKIFQRRLPTISEIRRWFQKPDKSIGIVTGKVSGHLEMLDFDHLAELYDAWAALVNQDSLDLPKRLIRERTQNSGLHVVYRCTEVTIPGNLKLAMRAKDVTDQVLVCLRDSKIDLADQGAVRKVLPSMSIKIAGKHHVPRLVDGNFVVIMTMIETRGEGGQFLSAPSPGYELLQGDFTAVPIITAEERQILINAALALNEYVDSAKIEGTGHRRPKGTERPGDAFNERGDVVALLEKHRWTRAREAGDYQHWRRPGKTRGQSASLIDGKIFYVFTQNAPPFEAGKAYSPFSVYGLLEHAGDYSAAARELWKEGYGEPGASGGDWPEPEPLRRKQEPGEPFPVEALGMILGEAAKAMHLNIKAPLAVCGQSVLATANLAVQGFADVTIDGRTFPVAEYFLSIALSGDRKTAADRAALVPVDAHQRELNESYKIELAKYESEAGLWESFRSTALRTKGTEARREAVEALPSPPTVPLIPQLTTQEPTYEGLAKLFDIGWPSVGLFSSEGGRFFGGFAMSQDHRLKTLAGLSEIWDGCPIIRTRSGDKSFTLYSRRLSAHLLMQPVVAETILADPLAHEQGFLSRCHIVIPESMLGEQTYSSQDLTREPAYGRYCTQITTIIQTSLPRKTDPVTGQPTNELTPRHLPVAPEAKAVWVRFHDWIQEHLRPDGMFRPISSIAAKAAEHALRLAGTLALVDDLNGPAITLQHLKNGIILAQFYLTEALRIFHTAKTNPDLLVAEKALAWLRTREGSEKSLISLPDIYQMGPNAVRDKATAIKVMQILSDHLWVKPVEGGAEVGGKKRRQVWEVSPYVFQGAEI
ncbi:MAG: DUF3987 domain-containing protein [Desulfobaccales bacterium]